MDTTARHLLPFIFPGQAFKEVTHNEGLIRLDAIVQCAVEDVAAAEAAGAADGMAWVVGAAPTGAWAQHPGEIAVRADGGWTFVTPSPGFVAWNKATKAHMVYDGSAWVTDGWPAGGLRIGGKQVVGPQRAGIPAPSGGTTADAEARAAIGQILLTLRAHGLIAP